MATWADKIRQLIWLKVNLILSLAMLPFQPPSQWSLICRQQIGFVARHCDYQVMPLAWLFLIASWSSFVWECKCEIWVSIGKLWYCIDNCGMLESQSILQTHKVCVSMDNGQYYSETRLTLFNQDIIHNNFLTFFKPKL